MDAHGRLRGGSAWMNELITWAKARADIFSPVSFSFLSTSPCCLIRLSFSSLCLLSCSSNLWVSTSSAFLSSLNRLCCDRRFASSSSSITSSSACSTVLPTRTSRMGLTSMSKSNNWGERDNQDVIMKWLIVKIIQTTGEITTGPGYSNIEYSVTLSSR